MGCPAKNSAQRDAVRLLLSTLLALVLITGAAAVGFAPFRPGQTEFFGSPPVLTDSVRVNINEADVSELCCLPEVGISRAEAIITYREQHGPYRHLRDLCNIEGIDVQMILSWGSMAYISEQDAEGF